MAVVALLPGTGVVGSVTFIVSVTVTDDCDEVVVISGGDVVVVSDGEVVVVSDGEVVVMEDTGVVVAVTFMLARSVTLGPSEVVVVAVTGVVVVTGPDDAVVLATGMVIGPPGLSFQIPALTIASLPVLSSSFTLGQCSRPSLLLVLHVVHQSK